MKSKIYLLLFVILNGQMYAHESGHEASLKQWPLTATNELIIADFIKYEGNEVWLMDENRTIKVFTISDFSDEDQKYIKAKSK
jgi:hypothetical protein